MIDFASYLKIDIITYFYKSNIDNCEKKNIQNRILMHKIFMNCLINNKYNFSTKKINLFILGKYTASMEAFVTIYNLQKIRNKNSLKKFNVKGLILENSIYLKETIKFIFPDYKQRFMLPIFFIFGKFSVFSSEFFFDFNFIRNKFINIAEWFPEKGNMSNIISDYREIYFRNIKAFLNNYSHFKFTKAILLKNLNGNNSFFYKKTFKEDIKLNNTNNKRNVSHLENFVSDFAKINKTHNHSGKAISNNSSAIKNFLLLDKKFEEKEYGFENLRKLSLEKSR